jgi:hypothetical protein
LTIVSKLKMGKSFGGFVRAEHIFRGSPQLIVHLHLLFNGLMQHGFVPTDFLKGTISPIVKDSEGDLSQSCNYRGVTLSVIFAQMFENVLRMKFGSYLGSDDLQFGFKKDHSTSHAVYALKSCVDYFNERGSSVYVTFMDFSKAFDTISHYGLFTKLMNRKVPLCFLLVLIFWYLNMSYHCKWGQEKSDAFQVLCGTKQGGILSPELFSLYIDDLVKILKKEHIGCHMIRLFLACILFADDLTLLAPTRSVMQRMIDICSEYCAKYCLRFNPKKTKVMMFGNLSKQVPSLLPLKSGDCNIEFVDTWRYLGFFINSGVSFSFTAKNDLRSFYRASNSILNVLRKPNEQILMSLLYTNCVPIISYGSGVKQFSSREMSQCNTAINDAIRKVFTFNRWESVRTLRESFGYESIYELFCRNQKRFIDSVRFSENRVLSHIASVFNLNTY